MMKFKVAAVVFLFAIFSPIVASARINTDFGVYFPVGGGSSSERASDNDSYALITVGKISEELRVRKKSGRLIMELHVSNGGDEPFSVDHRNGQDYDFALLDKKGSVIWRWSDNMAFTQALQTFTLAPGTAVTYSAEIERKDFKKLKSDAVLVIAFLTDTPYTVGANVPDAPAEASRSAITGVFRVGNGRWYDPRG